MDVNSLLEQLAPLVKEYEDKKKKRMDTGFIVFYLISDYYYRETFHGDILYALLSPEEKHGEGLLFVDLFIDMINRVKPLVDKNDYTLASVEREYGTNDGNDMGRIDFLIIGKNNHCIVVENKLNNAGDTYRQLPKYRKDLMNKGYIIDAFVYIPLDQNKEPDKADWEEEEINSIIPKLIIIPAYKIGAVNLIDNWLTLAEIITTDDDARFIIKHYKTLLNDLTLDIMDNRELVDVLLSNEHFDTTVAILENRDAISKKVKDDFIESLKKYLEVKQENDKITIIIDSDWQYVIQLYKANWKYYRHVEYFGEKQLPNEIDPIWGRFSYFPFGEDYIEEDKGWCYWEAPDTLRAMHNGTLLTFIVDEINKVRKRIDNL